MISVTRVYSCQHIFILSSGQHVNTSKWFITRFLTRRTVNISLELILKYALWTLGDSVGQWLHVIRYKWASVFKSVTFLLLFEQAALPSCFISPTIFFPHQLLILTSETVRWCFLVWSITGLGRPYQEVRLSRSAAQVSSTDFKDQNKGLCEWLLKSKYSY